MLKSSLINMPEEGTNTPLCQVYHFGWRIGKCFLTIRVCTHTRMCVYAHACACLTLSLHLLQIRNKLFNSSAYAFRPSADHHCQHSPSFSTKQSTPPSNQTHQHDNNSQPANPSPSPKTNKSQIHSLTTAEPSITLVCVNRTERIKRAIYTTGQARPALGSQV